MLFISDWKRSSVEELKDVTKPSEHELNLQQIVSFVGIASFGPLQLHTSEPNYGQITSTQK
jgi:hypothetical protein